MIESHTINKTIFSGISLNTIGIAFQTVLALINMTLLIRFFGIENYSLIVFLNLFAIFGALSFFDFGSSSVFERILSKYTDSKTRLWDYTFNVAIFWYFIIGLLIGLVLWFSLPFILENIQTGGAVKVLEMPLKIVALTYPFTFTILAIRVALNSKKKFWAVQFILIFSELIKFCVVIYSILNALATVELVLWVISLTTPILSFIFLCFFYQGYYFPKIRVFKIITLQVIRDSRWLVIGRLSSIIRVNADRVIAGIIGLSFLANIDIASKVSANLSRLFGVAASPIVAAISKYKNLKSNNFINNLYQKYFFIYVFGILFVVVNCIIYTSEILLIWLNLVENNITLAMQLFLVNSAMQCFLFGVPLFVIYSTKLKEYNFALIIGVAIKIIMIFILIEQFGLLAFPLSSLTGSLPIIYINYLIGKSFNISVFDSIRTFALVLIILFSPNLFIEALLHFDNVILRLVLELCSQLVLCFLFYKYISKKYS